ncbi:MAG TPA: hypothetical protein VFI06_11305 [Chitinophagaceae bacterium]|nr:hypothetical protein [Chitinophagaceae bacterium]
MKGMKKHMVGLCIGLLCCCVLLGQQEKKRISLKDSLDGAFDVSDYVIDANGFVPIPYIITEPALGGFGGALIPVFIKKRPPYLDSVKGKWVRTPVAPDVTGGIGLYTVNNTWGLVGFRAGTLVKSRIKYRIGGGYVNLNMSFYKTFDQLGEKEMKFNLKLVPLFLQATKRIRFSNWYAGFKYLFLKSKVHYVGSTLLDSLAKPLETERAISQLGAIVELDNRDNIFTPDKGIKFHVEAVCSDNVLGSDYDYWLMNYFMFWYRPLSRKLVGGLRIDGQQAFSDPPFYMLPFISMRGVPAARYQGNATLLSEGELRWDVVKRWSAVFFGGAGKAFDGWSALNDADWVWSYGTGFRYLLARKFKLRVGIDLAHGPGTWAYYIVFGSNWVK